MIWPHGEARVVDVGWTMPTGSIPEWMARAVCASVDPEIFYPEKGGSTAGAKQVCRACPVKAECLEMALVNNERYGIWGGVAERERRKLRHRWAA